MKVVKFIIILIFLYFFGEVLYLIPNKFITLDYFKIKEINVEGNSKFLSLELTEMINNTYNKNIWEIDTKQLENYLKQDIRIEDSQIVKKSLGKLDIYIKERELEFYVQLGSDIYLADKNGIIFGYMKEKKLEDTCIFVIKDRNEMDKLMEIYNKIADLQIKTLISQIYIVDKNCIELVLNDGVVIKTKNDILEEKYKIVESLYNELKKNNQIEYIDIRFDDFIVGSSREKKANE